MICPNCGFDNPQGCRFCISCGTLLPDIATKKVVITDDAGHKAVINVPVTDDPAPKQTVGEKLDRLSGLLSSHRLFAAAGAAVIVLILCIAGLIGIFSGGSGYDARKHSIRIITADGKNYFIYDDAQATLIDLEGSIGRGKTSMDGGTMAFITSEGTLAVIHDNKLTTVDEDVTNLIVSIDGSGVAYSTSVRGVQTLWLYDVKKDAKIAVTKNLSDSNFVIAPDGNSVCYYSTDLSQQSLMYFDGKHSKLITEDDVHLIAISTGGKYIYAIGYSLEDNDTTISITPQNSILYCYNASGKRTEIGSCANERIHLNKDHTQALYLSRGKNGYNTYFSKNGKEGQLFFEGAVSPLLPNNTAYYYKTWHITCPIEDFRHKVYRSLDRGTYKVSYIGNNHSHTTLLTEGLELLTLSNDGQTLYYITQDRQLKTLRIRDRENADEKAILLAEDVQTYQVTSDGNYIYYISDDALYCANAKSGKQKKTIAKEGVFIETYMNNSDVLYYIVGSTVYASKNGSKGILVLSEVSGASQTMTGIVYFHAKDGIYATSRQKNPHVILSPIPTKIYGLFY